MINQRDLRIACILDEFSFACFSPEARFLQLTPDNWKEELDRFEPHFLFVESAWRGVDNKWTNMVSKCGPEITGIINWCKERQIPTAFWNKEDPVHFSTFVSLASMFDAIFTTDMDAAVRYRTLLGNQKVEFLPFAAQPSVHNPVQTVDRFVGYSFAGSYYARYPARTRVLESFVQELPKSHSFVIFDRNYGQSDINYQFPQEYSKYILGRLEQDEIDFSYKSFTYGINLNSVQNSQTMLARRVYELMACNTLVVSNFARPLEVLFGELIVASDNGQVVAREIELLEERDATRELRRRALRKVFKEHLYEHRVSQIAKLLGFEITQNEAGVAVIISFKDGEELQEWVKMLNSQSLKPAKVVFVSREPGVWKTSGQYEILDLEDCSNQRLSQIVGPCKYVASLSPELSYDDYYLEELRNAFQYSGTGQVAKSVCFDSSASNRETPAVEYSFSENMPMPVSMFEVTAIGELTLAQFLSARDTVDLITLEDGDTGKPCFVIDSNGCGLKANLSTSEVESTWDEGWALSELQWHSKNAQVQKQTTLPEIDFKIFSSSLPVKTGDISISVSADNISIQSNMSTESHAYVYAREFIELNDIDWHNRDRVFVEATPGLDIMLVALYFNEEQERVGHSMIKVNENSTVKVPESASSLKFGFRVSGNGKSSIKRIVKGEVSFPSSPVLSRKKHVILTNVYPSYDNLYRNGFVHSRARAYKESGVEVEVVCLREFAEPAYREFEGISVLEMNQKELTKYLQHNRFESVLVHFLDPQMWKVLINLDFSPAIHIWVHGAEVQPWWRREYNATTEEELNAIKEASSLRLEFWREVFSNLPDNVDFIFVSQYFADEVIEDVNIDLPENKYSIIHNPIDSTIFDYVPKEEGQRLKILTIRPYASRKYANDVSVATVLALQSEPFFKELEFRFIGDGILFDEILEPIKDFENVVCERRFLTHNEIAEIHKQYGVFLTPTRMDAQGVSRDEAMSSGLVPLTSAVAAVPEFVSSEEGYLAALEKHEALAAGIREMYYTPSVFLEKSRNAADRVRRQCEKDVILKQELELILGDKREA